jgi:uncharacterized protein with PIN domain
MRKKCPECGEEISRLLASEVVDVDIELFVDGEEVFVGDRVNGGWRCPVCRVVLFWEFKDAAHFLGCGTEYDV